MKELYSFITPSEETLKQYFMRIMLLAASLGYVRRKNYGYRRNNVAAFSLDEMLADKPVEAELFRAHAPVNKVLELAEILLQGDYAFKALRTLKLRNSVYALNTLGLSQLTDGQVKLDSRYVNIEEVKEAMIQRASQQDSIIRTREILNSDPAIPGAKLGAKLSDILELNWNPKTCSRYGPALRGWAMWIEQETQAMKGRRGH
jgi:hypothetical protein